MQNSSELLNFDAGAILRKICFDIFGSWVGDHLARPQGAIEISTFCCFCGISGIWTCEIFCEVGVI